ncbi:MAG TPA: hypothetical protein VFO10_02730 [Oligoflexus sp.]|uniref:hypothetical protein n=1 Tax=Oligoflexus sp. TaxID=1971216 RepID=UPI002D809027|nr:hypothetical protein [Oligoflexus sp.]HET9236137.1 hypothetical protein [Oligoflexus sp.]
MKKFFDRFKAHELNAIDFPDFVSQWHIAETYESVFEFLGLTEGEYALFLQNPDKADKILREPRTTPI